jgi:hypothetical protein
MGRKTYRYGLLNENILEGKRIQFNTILDIEKALGANYILSTMWLQLLSECKYSTHNRT